MLQSDLHDAVGIFRGGQALVDLGNRPRHGLLGVQVFAGGERVEKMPRVNVQRAGDDDGVDIFHVEQAAMIVEGLNAGNFALSPGRDGGCRRRPWPRLRRRERARICPSRSLPRSPTPIMPTRMRSFAPSSCGGWIRQHSSRSHCGLLQKSAPALLETCKMSVMSSLLIRCITYNASACCRSFFIPAQLWRDDSSGDPAPRQCVSRLTAKW